MPDESAPDLAKLDAWCGVRPGMTRPQVLAALQQHSAEVEEYDDELLVTTDDWEMELHFTKDGSDRLRQLAITDGEIRWADRPLMNARLDEAFRALEPRGLAMWEADDEDGEPGPASTDAPAETFSDEELLDEGTVWLPERGLGLVISEGHVDGLVWRAVQDLPSRFSGSVTDAQRQLSLRPDIDEFLATKRTERTRVVTRKGALGVVRGALTIAAIVALVLVARKGFDEMRLWNQATTLPGRLVGIERVPMKQFRDFLPPALRWAMPATTPVIVDAYRVEYFEPGDGRREAVLERGELYVPPQQPGEEVPVAWVAGDPPRVKGLSRARDSAFVDYMPWAIAIGAIWLLAQFALGLLPALLRLLPRIVKRLVPTGVVVHSDRPESR